MGNVFDGTSGPRNAVIAIVGEAWGWNEQQSRLPFMGESGREFTRILADAGIDRETCFITNVFSEQPPENDAQHFFDLANSSTAPLRGLHPNQNALNHLFRLQQQLWEVRPKLTIAVGNYALWALTDRARIAKGKDTRGKETGKLVPAGIMSYRGSMLYGLRNEQVLPIIHPASILRQWSNRSVTIHDLLTRVPKAISDNWRPQRPATLAAPPIFSEAKNYLEEILDVRPALVAADIETLPRQGQLVCIGLCHSLDYAISIPFVQMDPRYGFTSYWTIPQEAALVKLLRHVLATLPIVGQNFAYDTQWIERDWGVRPNLVFDTMLAHHLVFPGMPKGLDYLSSLYCEHHWYWKDDAKDWQLRSTTLDQLLQYNCVDVLRTLECAETLRQLISQFKMEQLWEDEMEDQRVALEMMRRGVRIDTKLRKTMTADVMGQLIDLNNWLDKVTPNDWLGSGSDSAWYNSPTQTRQVFYSDLKLKQVLNRKTGEPTTGKEAFNELSGKYPRLGKLFRAIQAIRSLGVFHRNFLTASLSHDDRMKCSFNSGGTDTFRWSSSENALGSGTNLQNIPTGNEE